MLVVPPAIPVTSPLFILTYAIVASLLLHVPSGTISLRLVVSPAQIELVPDIFAGDGIIVTMLFAMQPAPIE